MRWGENSEGANTSNKTKDIEGKRLDGNGIQKGIKSSRSRLGFMCWVATGFVCSIRIENISHMQKHMLPFFSFLNVPSFFFFFFITFFKS